MNTTSDSNRIIPFGKWTKIVGSRVLRVDSVDREIISITNTLLGILNKVVRRVISSSDSNSEREQKIVWYLLHVQTWILGMKRVLGREELVDSDRRIVEVVLTIYLVLIGRVGIDDRGDIFCREILEGTRVREEIEDVWEMMIGTLGEVKKVSGMWIEMQISGGRLVVDWSEVE